MFLLFTVTGFSALILQVVWQRVISLHAGVDLFSITTVVSAFLAGIGLGSLLGGALADRLGGRRSLVAFARGMVDRISDAGPLVGRLFSVNTIGAGLGALASEWLLIGTLGFVGTVRLAGTLNILAAVLILTLSHQASALEAPGGAAPLVPPPALTSPLPTSPRPTPARARRGIGSCSTGSPVRWPSAWRSCSSAWSTPSCVRTPTPSATCSA